MELLEPMVTKLCSKLKMLYENQSKGNNSKTEQGRVTVLVHCTLSHCQKHAYHVWSHSKPMVTKLCSGQGKRNVVDADYAANQSNTYMSPFQTQKVNHNNKYLLSSPQS